MSEAKDPRIIIEPAMRPLSGELLHIVSPLDIWVGAYTAAFARRARDFSDAGGMGSGVPNSPEAVMRADDDAAAHALEIAARAVAAWRRARG